MTVREAIAQMEAAGGPRTELVRSLSLQIIAEQMSLAPGSLVAVRHPLIRAESANVNMLLQAPAAAHLVRAVERVNRPLIVISMLRSCVQQLPLRILYLRGLGVPLADPPGHSKHERGGALDVEDHAAWIAPLEAEGIRWHGPGDTAHFSDPSAILDLGALGVRAFQRLANRHGAKLAEDGVFGPATEEVMMDSPAEGFAAQPGPQPAPVTPDTVTFDGTAAQVRLVSVDGEHYANVRDLCAARGWQVGWDAGRRVVEVTTR